MEYLQGHHGVRAQLSYYLFVFRIYNQVKRIHKKTNDDKRDQAEHVYLELAKFPHLWIVLKWYQTFTNFLYIYALLKYIHPGLLPHLLSQLVGSESLLGVPVQCFLVGRFVAYPYLDRIVAILHAVANLSWRFTLSYIDRPYRLDLVDFLSQQDEHVRAYQAQYREQRRHLWRPSTGRQIEPQPPLPSPPPPPPHAQKEACGSGGGGARGSDAGGGNGDARVVQHPSEFEWRNKFLLFHAFMSYEATRLNLYGPGQLCGRLSSRPHNAKVLTMRPNRTIRAKRWLEHRISRMAFMIILSLFALCVVSLTLIAREISFDSHQLRSYPNCDLELERRVRGRARASAPLAPDKEARVNLDKLTTRTATPLHLALGVIDFVESAGIWFESGLGITFVFMLPYILVQDLKCYWRLWNTRLEALLHEARLAASCGVAVGASIGSISGGGGGGGGGGARGSVSGISHFHGHSDGLLCARQSQHFRNHHETATTRHQQTASPSTLTKGVRARLFEESLDELRQEICDFFGQFQQYELLMSDIISATFIFWFLGVFGFGYTIVWFYAAGQSILGIPLRVATWLFLCFFSWPLGLFSGCIFQLQGDVGKSYQTLHSLLVYMRPEAKEQYLKILEFFSEQKRHQFKFLMNHRFTPTVVVSIVSWTTSWLALFMSIVK